MKKFTAIIDKKGNFKIETGEGFSGNECHKVIDDIMIGINGQETDGGDKDSMYDNFGDPTAFVNK